MDTKTVVDNVYGSRDNVSNFDAIVNDCRRLLGMKLAYSNVKFIRKHVNVVTSFNKKKKKVKMVARCLSKVAP